MALNAIEIIGGIIIVLLSIGIVFLVLFQESPKGTGVSALTGGDSYYNKNPNRTFDAMLSRATKWMAIAFFVLVIAANVLPRIL